ncbi:MAG: MFS transporter [Deltaproteobacteria bacterium]|nr:MFS transporter [Deltaproteobacteria bacterium]
MGNINKKLSSSVKGNVFYAGLVSLFMDISSEMVYPLVPLFLVNILGVSKTTVGIIEGIAEATASVLKVFSGWLSDKLGKRKLLMTIGYGISALSRPVIAGAAVWAHVLGARFIDRLGKGIRSAPRDALIADSVEHRDLGTAFGFHRMMDTVGAIIGPAIAFILLFILKGNLRTVFLASAIPAVIAVLVIIAFVKEKPHAEKKERALPKLSLSSFNGPFRRYILVIAVFSLGSFADAFIILHAQNLGVGKEFIMILYLVHNVVYAASAIPLGLLADRIGVKKMVGAGFIYYSLIYAGLAAAASSVHIWLLFPLYGVYKGMSDGAQRAYLAHLAPEEKRATAFGVYHTIAGMMLLPASVIAGMLWDKIGPAAPFIYGSALSLTAAIVFLSGGRRA